MSSKGRTELQISLSRAKNCEEVAGDVRFCVAPQKLHKNCEKLNILNDFSEFFRTRPNASERIQMHPSASQQVQAGPSNSEIFTKIMKTCENFEKFTENLKENREDLIYFVSSRSQPCSWSAHVPEREPRAQRRPPCDARDPRSRPGVRMLRHGARARLKR